MDTRLVTVTLEIPTGAARTHKLEETCTWRIHAERIDALVDWLNWAAKQVKQESKRERKR